MSTRQIVEIILLGVVALLLIVNLFLYLNDHKNDTVSHILKEWAYGKFFFLTFAWGVLCGHFFFGTTKNVFGITPTWLYVIPVVIIIGILIFIGIRFIKKIHMTPLYQFMLFVTGVLYGHFFWSQRIHETII